MISKDYIWLRSYNPDNQIDHSTAGKWILHPRSFKRLFKKINELVDKGTIYGAKYTHKEFSEKDNLPYDKPVLCVYADDKTKGSTYEELVNLGIFPERWKYERETLEDWKESGYLAKRSNMQRKAFLYERLRELSEKY